MLISSRSGSGHRAAGRSAACSFFATLLTTMTRRRRRRPRRRRLQDARGRRRRRRPWRNLHGMHGMQPRGGIRSGSGFRKLYSDEGLSAVVIIYSNPQRIRREPAVTGVCVCERRSPEVTVAKKFPKKIENKSALTTAPSRPPSRPSRCPGQFGRFRAAQATTGWHAAALNPDSLEQLRPPPADTLLL
jgi:hypothetical protein